MSKKKSKKFSEQTILIMCALVERQLEKKYTKDRSYEELEFFYRIIGDYTESLLENLKIGEKNE